MSTIPNTPMVSRGMSAMQEWEGLVRQVGAQAESIIDLQSRLQRLYTRNDLAAAIAATAPGELVGDSGYTRESAIISQIMLESFEAWCNEPLPGTEQIVAGGITPLDYVSRRARPI